MTHTEGNSLTHTEGNSLTHTEETRKSPELISSSILLAVRLIFIGTEPTCSQLLYSIFNIVV